VALATGTVSSLATTSTASSTTPSTERYVVVTDATSVSSVTLPDSALGDAEEYAAVGAVVADLTPAQAETLEAQRGVTVTPDVEFHAADTGVGPIGPRPDDASLIDAGLGMQSMMSAKATARSWGLDRLDQRDLPLSGRYNLNPRVDGRGVHVYVVDSGLAESHREFRGRVGNGIDFVDGDRRPQECGPFPHGTHVAGTIGSSLFGVAPESTLHGVRVLNCRGNARLSNIIAAMDWIVRQQRQLGRTVVANLSFGGHRNRALNAATANMVSHGVVTVAAAGNEASDARRVSPASTPEAITVAASKSNDKHAGFSNYGKIVDLYAPGTNIWSTYAYDPAYTLPGTGTSMAAPHVSGWAALYLSARPQATPAEVNQALIASGTKGRIRGEVGGTPDILPFTKLIRATPRARIELNVRQRSMLAIDIDPDRPGQESWRVQGQRKSRTGWATVWEASTSGPAETLRRDVRPGSWRIVVPAQHGRARTTSLPVYVVR
jgi:subtilisin family serine protease